VSSEALLLIKGEGGYTGLAAVDDDEEDGTMPQYSLLPPTWCSS
jgi:hypothetical protein